MSNPSGSSYPWAASIAGWVSHASLTAPWRAVAWTRGVNGGSAPTTITGELVPHRLSATRVN